MALIEVQDAAGFDRESRVAWEYPVTMPPRSQRVLAEPTPERRAASNGNPRRAGSSQARALISIMTLGGKARRSPAARLIFEPGQALEMEPTTPFADDLARRVEPCRDRVIGHSLTRQ
jgi:hypothetical protein